MVKRKNILTEEEVAKRPKILSEVRNSDVPLVKSDKWINKERILFLKSRGLSHKGTKLMEDLMSLCPHGKKDSTLDDKKNLSIINEIAEIKNCTKILHFEARRNSDIYLWLSHVETGPSVKFLVKNSEFASDYKFSGNCLKGSRPLLSFSSDFDSRLELKFVKEMFTQVFGVPNHHPKSQPFIDRVYNFTLVSGQILFRHYQIVDPKTQELAEIGPRMHFEMIKVFEGSLKGRVLYGNENYVTRGQVRAAIRKEAAARKVKPIKDNKHKKAQPGTYVEDETDLVFAV